MEILLTDEETAHIIFGCKGTVKDARREVNKAQLKKVVEWGNLICGEHPNEAARSGVRWLFKHQCELCWQALLREIE